MGLIDLVGGGPLALDTSIFALYVRARPEDLERVEPVFSLIDEGGVEAVTSGLTLFELQTVAYRAGDLALAERYETLLASSRRLRLVELDRPLMRAAAGVRAATGARPPDAVQIATALTAGCTALLTDGRPLPELPGLRILQLRRLAAG